MFSVFSLKFPTDDDLIGETLVVITPEGDDWDYNSRVYTRNEASFIDILKTKCAHQGTYGDCSIVDSEDFTEEEDNDKEGYLVDFFFYYNMSAMYNYK